MYGNETLDETVTSGLKELRGLTNLYKQRFKAFGDQDRRTGDKDLIGINNEKYNQRTITGAYYFLLKIEEVAIKK